MSPQRFHLTLTTVHVATVCLYVVVDQLLVLLLLAGLGLGLAVLEGECLELLHGKDTDTEQHRSGGHELSISREIHTERRINIK